MTWCFLIITFAVCFQYDVVFAQRIPPTTTAAELWNPYTWYFPYAIAAAEGYRDYYEKAQKATNDLYQQVYATNPFPWITGNWNIAPPTPGREEQNKENTGKSTPKPEEATKKPEKPKSEGNGDQNQTGKETTNSDDKVQENNEDVKTTQTPQA